MLRGTYLLCTYKYETCKLEYCSSWQLGACPLRTSDKLILYTRYMHAHQVPHAGHVQSSKMAKHKVWLRWCCAVRLSCSQVSERSKSLGCWLVGHLLSPLSCRLSSFCWVVNCLSYLWTSVFRLLRVPELHCVRLHHERHVPKRYVNYIYFNRKPVIDIQAQPQTKFPLAPATPAPLWASH